MSGKSMDLNATADALREFNKAASLTIYNLTAFTESPAILQDGVLVVPSGGTSGGAVVNLGWDNSTHTLSFNVSHWTAYSWDGEPPTVYPGAVGYPAGQTTVRSGQSITLSATILDSFSGVKNATVNAASIGAGTVDLNNASGNWVNTNVIVSASDGTYNLNITAYDKAGNLNNTAQIKVNVVNTLSLPALVSSITPNSRNAQLGTPVTLFMSVVNYGTGAATGVSIKQASVSSLPVTVSYQQWDGTALIGSADTPADIAAGATANYVLTIKATSAFTTSSLKFNVSGTNVEEAPISAVNTLTIAASATPYADVIMMSTNMNISAGINNWEDLAVATTNVGANATGVSFNVVVPSSITGLITQVNQTYTNGSIKGPATGLTINAGEQPTFAVFVYPTHAIAFDPTNNRITLQLVDGTGKVIGAQSVAVSTT
jgi:hypothetical protein